ncbi:glycosyltransferase [Candidatus Gottesmanbacteria bacterium]|nr:glycosyltransferase [Candidatus Gottesmanbacteria bacterium]
MKVAIVHDYLREYGGAERVVEALHEIWPEAPLYTSFVDWPAFAKAPAGKVELFKSWDIRTSPVADNWLIKKFHSPLRFLAPLIWRSLDLSGYDAVISSSGWFMCRGVALPRAEGGVPWFSRRQGPDLPGVHRNHFAKAVTPLETSRLPARNNGPVHICYIHHPPRNLYGYATGSDLQKYWPVRVYATIVNFYLRHYDWETAQRVDYFIANSEETARRVEKFYRREAAVIYPPIEISQGVALQRGQQGHPLRKREYFLSVGRLTYSKRVDLAITACNKLNLHLKIVGTGKEEGYLRNLASQGQALRSRIEFLGSVTDEELAGLYDGAKALIFCALEEDFGMVPVEAMSHGVPVIALGQGGVLETVEDGRTGVLFQEPTTESLMEGIKKFNKNYNDYKSNNCYKQAQKFSKERFVREMRAFVEDAYRRRTV